MIQKIQNKSFAQQSALFARIAELAYQPPDKAPALFKKLGYMSTFISNKGSEAYIVEDGTDMIVACRGTEPKQWSDISADLSIDRVKPLVGVGKVHVGFKSYTDKLWDNIREHVVRGTASDKVLWVTGHSLGAAMATLVARRCVMAEHLQTPMALFTYGCPRVGNKEYVSEFNDKLVHHRWVNSGDIVTKVPLPPFFYHTGTMHHIGSDGLISKNAEKKNKIKFLLKLVLGFGPALLSKIMGDAKDHSIQTYVQRLTSYEMNEVDAEV